MLAMCLLYSNLIGLKAELNSSFKNCKHAGSLLQKTHNVSSCSSAALFAFSHSGSMLGQLNFCVWAQMTLSHDSQCRWLQSHTRKKLGHHVVKLELIPMI